MPLFLDQLVGELRVESQSMGRSARNNGRIASRNLPGTGCVFAVDLPRLSVAVVPTG